MGLAWGPTSPLSQLSIISWAHVTQSFSFGNHRYLVSHTSLGVEPEETSQIPIDRWQSHLPTVECPKLRLLARCWRKLITACPVILSPAIVLTSCLSPPYLSCAQHNFQTQTGWWSLSSDMNLFTQECLNAPTEAAAKGEEGWKLSYWEAVPLCSLQNGRGDTFHAGGPSQAGGLSGGPQRALEHPEALQGTRNGCRNFQALTQERLQKLRNSRRLWNSWDLLSSSAGGVPRIWHQDGWVPLRAI